VLRALHQFRARLDRYKLVSKRTIREELLRDSRVQQAMEIHCESEGVSELDCRVRVERYIDEIVPFFNVLSYYRFGYNIARVLVNLLYRVSSEYQDREALNAIPRRDIVVYLMNHRSNADYMVVAYVSPATGSLKGSSWRADSPGTGPSAPSRSGCSTTSPVPSSKSVRSAISGWCRWP
jgi:glycerol-3-phosphate O-acyltransferase